MTRTLLVSSGDGPAECRQAVAHLLAVLARGADLAGLDLDIAARDAPHGPSSAVVTITGEGADAFADDWTGPVQWVCRSALRPGHKRRNWFVQVFGLPPAPVLPKIDPRDVEMRTLRAGGPGGQHVNTTDSAVRASWTDPGGRRYDVVVRAERSQHRNRAAALARLAALVAADRAEAEAAVRDRAHALHGAVTRGAALRRFEGPDFQPARR